MRFLLACVVCTAAYALNPVPETNGAAPIQNAPVSMPTAAHTQPPALAKAQPVHAIAASKPQQQAAPSPLKITLAGKCFLLLVGLVFFVEAMKYAVTEYKARIPKDYSLPAWAEAAFSDEKLDAAKNTTTFVPVFVILMLFVMFRAKFGGFDDHPLYPLVQQFYIIGTVGIYLQALDAIDLTISSKTFGNLSAKVGFVCVYLGYGGIVFGAFAVKKDVLSVPAICILATTGLVFFLQIVILFLQYYEKLNELAMKSIEAAKAAAADAGAPAVAAAPAPEPPEDIWTPRLSAAVITCKYAPHLCIVFFYIYFRYQLIGKTIGYDADAPEGEKGSDNPIYCMYFAVFGIYLQAMGALVFSFLNKEFAGFCRHLGLLCLYGGFAGTLYYAVTAKEIESIPIKCALGLISFVCVFQLCLVFMEEYMTESEDATAKKKMFSDILSTLDYAVIMSILMIFIHFRSKMLEKIMKDEGIDGSAPIPGYANNACYGALGSMAVLILFTLMGAQLAVTKPDGTVEAPVFTLFIKALAILCLYVSFGTLVTTAFLLGDGPAPSF